MTATRLTTVVEDLLDDVLGRNQRTLLTGIFDSMSWAEEEIEKARARHPRHADRIYHSFMLLTPNLSLEAMSTEFVYRSHCRELLDRVADGTDTRPATAAEICCLMCTTSQAAPLTSAAAGLYMRMWRAAHFPTHPAFTEAGLHHEALEETRIDDLEQLARRKLTVAERRLGTIDCPGRHHGQPVTCPYAAANTPGLTA
jgi:hypothetical protein